jgi:primosomal protein N' (replication factor Y)
MTPVPTMPALVEVLPLGGFDHPLTYGAKQSLLDTLEVGSLVRIPLGVRRIIGVVASLNPKHCPPRDKLRFISALVQPEPVLSEELVKLAKWVSTYYASSLENTLGAMIPASVRDGMNAKTRKMIEVVSLPPAEVDLLLKRSPKQLQAYGLLSQQMGQKIDAVAWGKKHKVSMSVLDGLIQKGMVRQTIDEVKRDAYEDQWSEEVPETVESLRELTEEQQKATDEICQDLDSGKFCARLLQGVTGSGKTEVYCQAMEKALDQGGGVLFLVPEVALAPQTVDRLRARFGRRGEQVVVWHSHLSAGERLDAWRQLVKGEARIVVGARSAVFAPVQNLRLVVVDEEHEPAYKQEDSPRYHGRDVAVYRAFLNQGVCLLGSATPSLETARNVERTKYQKSVLSQRIDGRELPLVHLVDMRREALKQKSAPILSQQLIEALRQRYENREQSILFLNRRGFNTTMFCTECGEVEQCRDCSIAMTYHRTDHYLHCHLCGYRKPAPRVCGNCNSIEISRRGHGTQRIEDVVESVMPRRAKVVRVDADVMTKKNLFREILRDFRQGKIDVLVGTQMIAKGLDFPRVTLVGVIDADLPLRMEDFRASERAFQILVQVAGRAGRGDRAGEVYVQTYAPHESCIQFARRAELDAFLEDELAMRKELSYPPYRHLIRHVFRGRGDEKTRFYAEQWRKRLDDSNLSGVEVKGPAATPLAKMKGYYRYHLFYLSSSVSNCLGQIQKIRNEFPIDNEVFDILDVDAQQVS